MRDLSILNTEVSMVEVSVVSSERSRSHYLILSIFISFTLYILFSLPVSLHSFHCIGTGHGVGAALNVHEGPHSVSRVLNPQPLVAGMVVSK